MAQILLSIEIGERFVSVCVSSGSAKSFKITKSFRFEHVGDVLSDGQITNPTYLADQIKEAMSQNGIGDIRKVNFVFNSSKVVSREVNLPSMKENKIADVISLNASEYFPIDITNFNITHTVLKPSEAGSTMRVMLTAVPKTIVKSIFELAEALKVSVNAIDYAPNAQYQLLKSIKSEEIVMYLNMNIKNSTASFIQNGTLLLQRNLPFGGDEIVSAVLRNAELEEDEYVKILEQSKKGNWLELALTPEQIQSAMLRLTAGINRSLEFFTSSQKGLKVDRIVLLGICADIYGLKTAISSASSINCEVLSYVPSLEKSVENIEDFISYISPIGSLINPLNLLQGDLVKKHKMVRSTRSSDSLVTSILIFIFAVVAGVALSATSFFEYASEQRDLDRLNMEYLELKSNEPTRDAYVQYKQMHENIMAVATLSEDNNQNLVAFLEELEDKVPRNLLALSASCTNENITLNVTVQTFEEVAVTMANLREFESVEVINVSAATQTTDENTGVTQVDFSITCEYKTAVIEESTQESEVEE